MKAGIPCRFKIKDKSCGKPSVKIDLSPRQSRQALGFQPTLLYVKPDGQVVVPGRNDPDLLPKRYKNRLAKQGYKEVKISNYRDYEKHQKSMREIFKDQRDAYVEYQQNLYDQQLKEGIDFLKQGGTIEMPNPDGSMRLMSVPSIDKMEPSMRRLAEYAIERAKNHKISGELKDPQIQALEYDNTSYRDKDTGWKERR
jgi:hypothetical protein